LKNIPVIVFGPSPAVTKSLIVSVYDPIPSHVILDAVSPNSSRIEVSLASISSVIHVEVMYVIPPVVNDEDTRERLPE
jgi:hypothetical protein